MPEIPQPVDPLVGAGVWSSVAAALGAFAVWLKMRTHHPPADDTPASPRFPGAARPTIVCGGMQGEQAERIKVTHELVEKLARMAIEEGEDGVARSRARLMHEQLMGTLTRSMALQSETQSLIVELLDRLTDRRATPRIPPSAGGDNL